MVRTGRLGRVCAERALSRIGSPSLRGSARLAVGGRGHGHGGLCHISAAAAAMVGVLGLLVLCCLRCKIAACRCNCPPQGHGALNAPRVTRVRLTDLWRGLHAAGFGTWQCGMHALGWMLWGCSATARCSCARAATSPAHVCGRV